MPNPSRKSPLWWTTLVLFVALVAYPLSIGPDLRLWQATDYTQDWIVAPYRPLIRATWHDPTGAVAWYGRLWSRIGFKFASDRELTLLAEQRSTIGSGRRLTSTDEFGD